MEEKKESRIFAAETFIQPLKVRCDKMDVNYREKAQEPEETTVVGESAAAMYAVEHVVHVPVNAHGRDIDWTALQTWLALQAQAYVEKEQQSTQPLRHQRPSSRRLTDEELERELEGLPSWDDVEHPEMSFLTKEDYNNAIRKMARRPIKGIEKWL